MEARLQAPDLVLPGVSISAGQQTGISHEPRNTDPWDSLRLLPLASFASHIYAVEIFLQILHRLVVLDCIDNFDIGCVVRWLSRRVLMPQSQCLELLRDAIFVMHRDRGWIILPPRNVGEADVQEG